MKVHDNEDFEEKSQPVLNFPHNKTSVYFKYL